MMRPKFAYNSKRKKNENLKKKKIRKIERYKRWSGRRTISTTCSIRLRKRTKIRRRLRRIRVKSSTSKKLKRLSSAIKRASRHSLVKSQQGQRRLQMLMLTRSLKVSQVSRRSRNKVTMRRAARTWRISSHRKKRSLKIMSERLSKLKLKLNFLTIPKYRMWSGPLSSSKLWKTSSIWMTLITLSQ